LTNCEQSVAKRGWDIYRAATPAPSLETINAMLGCSDKGGVSSRTYRHYRRMAFHGFQEYLPINELDVRLKLRRAGLMPG
jgi:hypothetical protein